LAPLTGYSQLPLAVGLAASPVAPVCEWLAAKYRRTLSGSGTGLPVPSWTFNDAFICQNSLPVSIWMTSGSVAGRFRKPSRTPEIGSVVTSVGSGGVGIRHEVVVVVLARIDVRIGELDVGKQPVRTRNRNSHRVEYLFVPLVFIEAKVQIIAQIHAGRRAAEGVRTANADRGPVLRQRVRVPGIVFQGVAKERGQIAGHGVAKAHHRRLL